MPLIRCAATPAYDIIIIHAAEQHADIFFAMPPAADDMLPATLAAFAEVITRHYTAALSLAAIRLLPILSLAMLDTTIATLLRLLRYADSRQLRCCQLAAIAD